MKSVLTIASALCLTVLFALPAYADAGGRGDRDGKGKHKRKRPSVEKIFEKFDKDESGSLTSDEVPERPWTRISKADADGDGAVTKKELKDAFKKRRGKRGGKRGGDKPPRDDD